MYRVMFGGVHLGLSISKVPLTITAAILFLLVSGAMLGVHAEDDPELWPVGTGDHQVVFIFDDSVIKGHEQPWLIGSFDIEGDYDDNYSVGFLPMRDDGQEGDEKKNDHIWSLTYNFFDSDEEFSVLVFPDRSSMDSNQAIDVKNFTVSDRRVYLSAISEDVVTINIKTPVEQNELYLRGICAHAGDEIWRSDVIAAHRAHEDDEPADMEINYQLWQAHVSMPLYPPERTIQLYSDSGGQSFATLTGTIDDSLNIFVSTFSDKLADVEIVFRDYSDEASKQVYLIGSWDDFGEYSDLYTGGLTDMSRAYGDDAAIQQWTYHIRLAPDERSCSVLFFDSKDTIEWQEALHIEHFDVGSDTQIKVDVVFEGK